MTKTMYLHSAVRQVGDVEFVEQFISEEPDADTLFEEFWGTETSSQRGVYYSPNMDESIRHETTTKLDTDEADVLQKYLQEW